VIPPRLAARTASRRVSKKFTVVLDDDAPIHTEKVVTEKLPEWDSRNFFVLFVHLLAGTKNY
jgi:hypothetical protein